MSTHDEGREAATEIIEVQAGKVRREDLWLWSAQPPTWERVTDVQPSVQGMLNFYGIRGLLSSEDPFRRVIVRRPVSSPGNERRYVAGCAGQHMHPQTGSREFDDLDEAVTWASTEGEPGCCVHDRQTKEWIEAEDPASPEQGEGERPGETHG